MDDKKRIFTVDGSEESVDDVMLGIPKMFRDEFVGTTFKDYKDFSLCLAHADTAKRAKFEECGWLYEQELDAMRVYLK